jgi:spermidine synthase
MSETSGRRRRLIFAIFTISGFSGLIYESIWSHYLKLFLGHAAYAQTLVLAIFMGGMAVGSWLMAKYSHRVRNLLLGYAIVEGIIGLCGLLFHQVSTGAMAWAFDSLLPNLDSVAAAQIAKWALGAVLILPQSILLGMTFPLMSGATVRRFPERSGETLAMLYFTNSLGAALGVLVSGFVLIGAVGLPGTILTAGLMNIGLALFVWGLVKYQPDMVLAAAPKPATTAEASTGETSSLLRWMLIGACVTGAASFLYEIAWIRMLSLVLGSSTHSFEMMLSAFILGIALGGLWVHKKIDRLANPVRFLSNILIIMAVVAVLSLPVYNASFDMMATIIQTFSPTEPGYIGRSIASNVIAMLVMIPTTFFCGMTLPIITHVLLRNGTGERAIGAVYAWNTAGAIIGTVLAVQLLMPLIGVKGLVITGAALQLGLAALYRSRSSAEPVKHAAGVALAGVVALVVAAVTLHLDPKKLNSGVYRHGAARATGEVTFLEHGRTATITLMEGKSGMVTIATNGKPDASIDVKGTKPTVDEITMVLAGALPFALRDDDAPQVANIGFGSGLTSHVLLTNPSIRTLDTIEIEPMMAKAAEIGFHKRVPLTFDDPRSHIHFEDAKTYFAMHKSKYDLIVSEPSNPWVSGVATLFSREFYQQMKRYLNEDGMMVQWLQIYEVDQGIVLSVIGALAPEFEDFAIYNTDDTNLLIVAVRKGRLGRPTDRPFRMEAMKAELAKVGIHSTQDIESRFVGNKELLMPLVASSGVPANSDYFPFVDQNAARARILQKNALEFTLLQTLPVPVLDLIQAQAPTREVSRPTDFSTSSRDRMLIDASELMKAVESSEYDKLDPAVGSTLLALRSSAADCAKPSVQRSWITAAHFLAANTSGPLAPAELSKMWDTLARTPCGQALQGGDGQMLALMRAIALRDVQQVATLGPQLLKDYEFAEASQVQYVLLASVASAIAVKDDVTALQLVQEHGAKFSQVAPVSLAMKMMATFAASRNSSATRGAVAQNAP